MVYVGARFDRAEAGSGPVFLEKLNCIMSDHSLLDCQSYSANEPSSCDHSQDISIQCTGSVYFAIMNFLHSFLFE